MKVKILYDRPVSKNITQGNSNIACAFAQTTVMSNGDIVCLYRQGKTKHSLDGILVMQSSSDFGYTWSEGQTVFKGLELQPTQSVLSHSICTTQTGALLITFFLIEAAKPDLYVFSDEGFRLKRKICAIRSEDEGRTWSDPIEIEASFPRAGITSKPVILPDGTIIVPLEIKTGFGPQGTGAVFTKDDGRTFDKPVMLIADPLGKLNLCDARFTVLNTGDILMLLWAFKQNNSENVDVHRTFSSDNGKTWSACEPVGMLGGLTVPLALTHGILLGVSQFRQPPEGLRLWVSRDNGVTWDTENSIQMWDAGQNRMLGMPVTQLLRKNKETDIWSDLKDWTFGTQDLVLLDDGTIMMTYYATLENIIHIRACRFRVRI